MFLLDILLPHPFTDHHLTPINSRFTFIARQYEGENQLKPFSNDELLEKFPYI